MLNEVPAAVEHDFGPTVVQCKSQAPPDLLEEDGLANPMVDIPFLYVRVYPAHLNDLVLNRNRP